MINVSYQVVTMSRMAKAKVLRMGMAITIQMGIGSSDWPPPSAIDPLSSGRKKSSVVKVVAMPC